MPALVKVESASRLVDASARGARPTRAIRARDNHVAHRAPINAGAARRRRRRCRQRRNQEAAPGADGGRSRRRVLDGRHPTERRIAVVAPLPFTWIIFIEDQLAGQQRSADSARWGLPCLERVRPSVTAGWEGKDGAIAAHETAVRALVDAVDGAPRAARARGAPRARGVNTAAHQPARRLVVVGRLALRRRALHSARRSRRRVRRRRRRRWRQGRRRRAKAGHPAVLSAAQRALAPAARARLAADAVLCVGAELACDVRSAADCARGNRPRPVHGIDGQVGAVRTGE